MALSHAMLSGGLIATLLLAGCGGSKEAAEAVITPEGDIQAEVEELDLDSFVHIGTIDPEAAARGEEVLRKHNIPSYAEGSRMYGVWAPAAEAERAKLLLLRDADDNNYRFSPTWEDEIGYEDSTSVGSILMESEQGAIRALYEAGMPVLAFGPYYSSKSKILGGVQVRPQDAEAARGVLRRDAARKGYWFGETGRLED